MAREPRSKSNLATTRARWMPANVCHVGVAYYAAVLENTATELSTRLAS